MVKDGKEIAEGTLPSKNNRKDLPHMLHVIHV